MRFNPLHCWDCGIQVVFGEQGSYEPGPSLRLVRFDLVDGSYCESPFCVVCADKPWTFGRLRQFEQAVNDSPIRQPVRVHTHRGSRKVSEPIVAIVE